MFWDLIENNFDNEDLSRLIDCDEWDNWECQYEDFMQEIKDKALQLRESVSLNNKRREKND